MNSIASPRRTDPAALPAETVRTASTVLASIVLTVLMISFRPFQPAASADTAKGGDIVNQLGYAGLGVVAVLAVLALADRRRAATLLSGWWAAMIAMLFFSTLAAADPGGSMRTALFTLFAMVAMSCVVVVVRDADSLSRVLVTAAVVVLGMSYAGLVVFPDIAKHTADSLEAQHAGLWRGVFSHKNIAGPVMAVFSFAGIYLMRRSWRRTGIAIFVLAIYFMAHTGSKTTLGSVPLVAMLVIVPGIVGLRRLTPLLFVAGLAIGALATIGIVFIPALKALAHDLAPDLTYTGRTQLWAYAGEMIAKSPWRGYGFESFWGTPLVTESDRFFDDDWDISNIVHGHDGYLDIAIGMGLPALAVAVTVLVLLPSVDYARTPLLRENVLASDFFMMAAAFCALNGLLETFFFRRADPVWLLFFMAVIGLRVTARLRFPAREEN